jgi:hypothetical protein
LASVILSEKPAAQFALLQSDLKKPDVTNLKKIPADLNRMHAHLNWRVPHLKKIPGVCVNPDAASVKLSTGCVKLDVAPVKKNSGCVKFTNT